MMNKVRIVWLPKQSTTPSRRKRMYLLDFELVVGEGEKQKMIHVNKAVVAFFLPGMEELVEDKQDRFA